MVPLQISEVFLFQNVEIRADYIQIENIQLLSVNVFFSHFISHLIRCKNRVLTFLFIGVRELYIWF